MSNGYPGAGQAAALNYQQGAQNNASANWAQQAMNVPLGHTYPQAVRQRWDDTVIWNGFAARYEELSDFIKATAKLLDCEVQTAYSPFSPTVRLGTKFRDHPLIWSIHHPELDVRVQWMANGHPGDEEFWRCRFAELAEIMRDEREYREKNPMPQVNIQPGVWQAIAHPPGPPPASVAGGISIPYTLP